MLNGAQRKVRASRSRRVASQKRMASRDSKRKALALPTLR